MERVLTVNDQGIYNIYFEKEGQETTAIFNAVKNKKYKQWVEQNKHNAISLNDYLEKTEESEEIEEIETLEEGVEEIGEIDSEQEQ